jgi:hypothetical protein
MATQKIEDNLYVSGSISSPIYIGDNGALGGINEGQTATILTITKGQYAAIVLDVYLSSEQYPEQSMYALQTVHILIHTYSDSDLNVNPYYGQVFINAVTNASGPDALGGAEARFESPIFTTDTIEYTADTSGETILIKLTHNAIGAGVITCQTVVRSFIAPR